ncbi:hydroxymethylglutaryl-CoA lyase [Roseomonas sp. NAR14]|uniref:Hydroxymethylglutaryl-CoA lyase n=1 Tax=Roseomonas acroporae TaxID=2937791 RepID=A0A9X2BWM8_9PROT|nr:hydroxymethylglutaryl-CoA lyase [Roseomonas acroporae]MCK8786221.1 hydroxymethylglutaryl-CoA lyase [Roseomonas acroporae]
MAGDRPRHVTIREEGPREGFQIEPRPYPLAERAALVEALAAAGLRSIQVASFVSPRKVPQMADAEALFALIRRRPGVHYDGLWLNEQGFHRARATPGVDLEGRLALYASDSFARRNNDCAADEMHARQARWLDLYAEAGVPLSRAIIVTAFGCCYEGAVPPRHVVGLATWVDRLCRERGQVLPEITLADTVGLAGPDEVRRLVGMVREALPETRIGLHLHDTRGLGLANVAAALEMGVDAFDSSVAGLGGCPFAAHGDHRAAGNVCTEDLAFLCDRLGIGTGIDLGALVEASRLAERIVGRPLGGRLMHAGLPERRAA